MSSIVEQLFARIRAKKVETVSTLWSRYDSLLDDIAAGRNVDPELAADITDEMNITAEQLAKDVERKTLRISYLRRYRESDELKKQIPKLQAASEKLQAEYNRFVSDIQPKLQQAYTAVQFAETELGTCLHFRTLLVESCVNPLIEERERQIAERRRELYRRERQLRDDLSSAGRIGLTLLGLKTEMSNLVLHEVKPTKPEFIKCKTRMDSYQASADEAQAELDEIHRQGERLTAELNAIEEEKIKP